MVNPLRFPIVLFVVIAGLAFFVSAAHRQRQGEPLLDRLGRGNTELPLRHDDRGVHESFPSGRLSVDAPPTTWETSLSSARTPPAPVPSVAPSTPLPRASDGGSPRDPVTPGFDGQTSRLGRIVDNAPPSAELSSIARGDTPNRASLGQTDDPSMVEPAPTVGFSPEPAQRVRTPLLDDDLSLVTHHRICDGDTLKRLAERYLGDEWRYLEIFAANRDILTHPDLLPVGETIRIPPR